MSDAQRELHWFSTGARRSAVALPFDLRRFVGQWSSCRAAMVRERPAAFTRDEWAYLVAFLDPANLMHPFFASFGMPEDAPGGPPDAVLRPRGEVAVWLPNSASLLGPLTLILVSLTSAPMRIKAGSRSEDLTEAFLRWASERTQSGPLGGWLAESVSVAQFDRADARNAAMAAGARVRIVFGGDAAVAAVASLPHPPGSVLVPFADHRSEAWIDVGSATPGLLTTLARVFAVYGSAGCTSPRRVVVIDGTPSDATTIRDRLAEAWPAAVRGGIPMHVASGNVRARQEAAALGWDAVTTERSDSVLATGGLDAAELGGVRSLQVVAASVPDAVRTLPANIQTVGHALRDSGDPRWIDVLAKTSVMRFVPVAAMHHFGPVWDGAPFWRQLFDEVEVRL